MLHSALHLSLQLSSICSFRHLLCRVSHKSTDHWPRIHAYKLFGAAVVIMSLWCDEYCQHYRALSVYENSWLVLELLCSVCQLSPSLPYAQVTKRNTWSILENDIPCPPLILTKRRKKPFSWGFKGFVFHVNIRLCIHSQCLTSILCTIQCSRTLSLWSESHIPRLQMNRVMCCI